MNSIFAGLNFNTVFVDYKKQVTSRFGPLELTKCLLDGVNPNWEQQLVLPVLDSQQPARWILELVQVLCDQLTNINLANASNASWFIVLDRFNDITVPRETIDMIQVLGSVATGKQNISGNTDLIRLVLLGFNDPILNYRNRVVTDEIREIDNGDLENYFKRYASFKGRDIDNDALAALVQRVRIDELKGDENRTQKIAQKALQIAIAVFEN